MPEDALTGGNPVPEVVVQQARARAFDWQGVATEFLAGPGIDHKAGMPRLRRTEQEARA